MKKYLLSLCLVICMLAIAAIPIRPLVLRMGLTGELDSPLLPPAPFSYEIFANPLPDHFFEDLSNLNGNVGIYTPASVLPTEVPDHIETLGRVLFYDKQLSINNTVSCATCHIQAKAFADTLALSLGFDGSNGERNSIGFSNVFIPSMRHFFWDAGTDAMATQIKLALESEVEMGMNPALLKARIENTSFYPKLFQNAFGDSIVTVDRSVAAIRSFVLSMLTLRSKYDFGRSTVGHQTQSFANFSKLENRGKDIFFGINSDAQCASCHQGELFISNEAVSNGLDFNPTDLGFGGVTNLQEDMGKFRVPSLRNIGFTAPYMHDGRFASLGELVEHYSTGVSPHSNLHPFLIDSITSQPKRLNLSPTEKRALIAFLHTLSDTTFIRDVRWSNPFDPNPAADTIPVNRFSFIQPVDPVPFLDHLLVAPNPSAHTMSFDAKARFVGVSSLQVFSLSGQLVYQEIFDGTPIRWEHKRQGVPEGIYLVRLESDGGVFTKKVQVIK
ncbi:MAG: cytochrome c peroxidase [Bacteroidia bacterium]